MLSKVEVDNLNGPKLSLPLQDNTAGFTVRSITGLDPVKANIVSSSFAQLDGSKFQAARLDNRNIVLTVGLEPYSGGSTVPELRSVLYGYFMPKSVVVLSFYMDDVHYCDIQGTVESFENPLFSKDPEVNISVICFDPFFSSPDEETATGDTVAIDGTEVTINNPGNVPVGFRFDFEIDQTFPIVQEVNLYTRRPNGDFTTMALATDMNDADQWTVISRSGEKAVFRYAGGLLQNMIYAMLPTAEWPLLYPGDNFVRVTTDATDPMPWFITYTPKYGGL